MEKEVFMIENVDKGIIEVDPRHTIRSIRTAIQGNVNKTLIELITNSHDSYTRIEESANDTSGLIKITYEKEGNTGFFSVIDNAEGMSRKEVKVKLTSYGRATSGFNEGYSVRGYFGQGVKDALISMIDGEIHTIKEDMYTKCKLYIEENKPKYEIEKTIPATAEIRKKLEIPVNGTVAKFKADPSKDITVPHLSTIQSEISNNYQLRKILMSDKRKILLLSQNEKKTRKLKYISPPGLEIESERFELKYKSYNPIIANLSIWRSEKELSQKGDTREGGILIIDGNQNVLGISLFKFENEPLASHLFGELKLEGFSELLKAEEPVLKEERDTDGLATGHPFCKKLIENTEEILQKVIDKEKKRKQKESEAKLDKESRKRFKKAFDILNEIAEEEAKDVEPLGNDMSEDIEPPPGGLMFYPSKAKVTVGKKYRLRLRIDTNKFKPGSLIKISSSNKAVKLITNDMVLHFKDRDQILDKFVSFEAIEPNKTVRISAEIGSKSTYSDIVTFPEKDFLFTEGMVFKPQSITLHPNKPKTVTLYVYIKMISGGSNIRITSDNKSIKTSIDEIYVNEALAEKDIYESKFEIWGEGIGQRGVIYAEYEDIFLALLDVRVTSKEEEEYKGFKGIFKDYEFNFEEDPLQRVSYSSETGKIFLYGEFPSVKHYIGEYGKFSNSLAAQVFVADIVSETCFREIARRKVERGALITTSGKSEKINMESSILSKKYGFKLHQILVDQDILIKDQSKINKSNSK
jgi:hypothetical protein